VAVNLEGRIALLVLVESRVLSGSRLRELAWLTELAADVRHCISNEVAATLAGV